MIYYKVSHKYKLVDHYEKKHIGIYSTKELAEQAVKQLQDKQGFNFAQDGFKISKVVRLLKPRLLDRTYWVDGFIEYTS